MSGVGGAGKDWGGGVASSSGERHVLDARGYRCPLPVLRTRKALAALPAGAGLEVRVTDPAARIDMAHFCATEGHELREVVESQGVLTFLIVKG